MSDARGAARRRAELARESSDVRRSRGVVVGALAGALSLVLALAWFEGPRSLASPGPLARPHRALECASCHAASRARATCEGCHAEHPSRRTRHRELAASGALRCGDCHAIHRAEYGLAFEAGGGAEFYGPGVTTRFGAPDSAARGATPTTFVPLVDARACARCHDTGAPNDAAAHCFAGDTAFSLCFDEHRRPGRASASVAAERDAAVEAARALVLERPGLLAQGRLAAGAYVAFALGAAGLAFAGVRRRARGRAVARSDASKALPLALEGRRLPVIDTSRCLGCNACVDACPYDVLEVRRYVAVVARPGDCCGAGPCLERCPNGSLVLEASVAPRGPRLGEGLEAFDRPGVYLAGDITGGSLVRNALRQGRDVARAVARRFGRSESGAGAKSAGARMPARNVADLVVVGAGPAGLAAALEGERLGLSVTVLEQASVAESIRRFSRQKLVLDADSGADEALPLWIGDAPKEELLSRWQRALRLARLDVREQSRVLAVHAPEVAGDAFRVAIAHADGRSSELRGSSVLLAVGARGSPRKLEARVPAEAEGRVHYELSDARAFAGRRIVVVGLGDVAMESAVALAAQPGTRVSVVHRGKDFRRGKRKNIAALAELVARGRVELALGATVAKVAAHALEIEQGGARRTLPFDALFVHIGSVPCRTLLEAAGICFRA